MKPDYKIYPDYIQINNYYWLRRRNDLFMTVIKVLDIESNDKITVLMENDHICEVKKRELLIFDPNSRLFKVLMKNSQFRHDAHIKKILTSLNYKPDVVMRCVKKDIDKTDGDLKEADFYHEYHKFVQYDKDFCDDNMFNIEYVIVTGTSDMDVYTLYKTVCENGGMERITDDQKWKNLFYSSMSKTNVSYTIRTFYKKYLYEFEFFRRKKEEEFNFNYKYNIRDKIYININNEFYYGTVKLRRNRGINQYYIQFFSWSKENSEWFSEDVLRPYNKMFNQKHNMKRKTRSSKANNLIDDPLTREKHSHSGRQYNRMEPRINEASVEMKQNEIEKNIYDTSNQMALHFLKKESELAKRKNEEDFFVLESLLEPLQNNYEEFETNNNKTDNEVIKKIQEKGVMAKKNDQKGKKKRVIEVKTGKRRAKNKKEMQELDIIDESENVDEFNYCFTRFFNFK